MPKSQLYGMPARYLATPPTLEDGDAVPLLVDINGKLMTSGGGGGGATASNGLTAVGSDIQLGGTLTQDTQIDAAGKIMNFIDTTGTTATMGMGIGNSGVTPFNTFLVTPSLAGIQSANTDGSQTNLFILTPNSTTISLFSPDGTKYNLQVDNAGVLSTTPG